MSPDDARHGEPGGYDAHRRDNEDACDPCKDAAARYEYDRRIGRILGRTLSTPGLGAARRIQALVALGWSFTDLAPEFGWAHDGPRKIAFQGDAVIRKSTAARVAEVYDRLSMTTPSGRTGSERRRVAIAKGVAARYGWAPPLAWDEGGIDDPRKFPRWDSIPCSTPNCGDPTEGKGKCRKHYRLEARANLPKRTNSIEERLAAYIDRIPGGCWLWIGALNQYGYGSMRSPTGTVATHRFVYEREVGPIPEGLDLDHLCRIRSCCNPAHLEPVTRQENVDRGAGSKSELCKNGHPFDILAGTRQERRCSICERAKRLARTARLRAERAQIDEATVLRIMAGEVLPANVVERDEVVRRWVAAGNSERSLCERMGWKDGRYGRQEQSA